MLKRFGKPTMEWMKMIKVLWAQPDDQEKDQFSFELDLEQWAPEQMMFEFIPEYEDEEDDDVIMLTLEPSSN